MKRGRFIIKNKILTTLLLGASIFFYGYSVSADVTIDSTNFPDDYFRAYVERIDANSDGILSEAECLSVTGLHIPEKNISDLTGIKYFKNLIQLFAWSNQLTSLDLTELTKLRNVNVQRNQLTTIKVTGLTNLVELNIDYNQLNEIDLTGLVSLQSFYAAQNQFHEIDLTGSTNLNYVTIANNQIETLVLTGLTNLESLYAANNQLNEINLTGLTSLDTLDVSNNQLNKLELTDQTNLFNLYANHNQLEELDLTGLTKLRSLKVEDNQLKELDLTGLTGLIWLYVSNNQLKELDLTGLTKLLWLCVSNNQLKELDLTELTQLVWLEFENNQLAGVDLDSNLNLYQLIMSPQNPTTVVTYVNGHWQVNLNLLKINYLDRITVDSSLFTFDDTTGIIVFNDETDPLNAPTLLEYQYDTSNNFSDEKMLVELNLIKMLIANFSTDDRGILNSGEDQLLNSGETLSVIPTPIANNGYEFSHWIDSKGNTYTNDELALFTISENETFTAIFKEKLEAEIEDEAETEDEDKADAETETETEKPNDKSETKAVKTLPKTGERNSINSITFGLITILFVSSSVLFKFRTKKTN